jgi:predicted dehydrogenase
MLGSGFIAEFYMAGLRHVPGAAVVANYSRGQSRRAAFAAKHGIERTYDSIEALCADTEVDLVVIALPNLRHLESVRAAAAAGKAIVCTKPLGRDAAEAADMARLVREAGVMGGYAENTVFAPDLVKVRAIVESGGIGEVLSVRSREGHSGPHAPHFWNAGSSGGGALLDMGCHSIETARYLVGKEVAIRDVFAWGATLVHGARTTGEDTAVALLRFEDGRTAIVESSWIAKGGMEVRNEVYGTAGRLVHDTLTTSVKAFIERPAGYLAEKADADTGWVFPVPDEPRVHGYDEQFRHFVECFRTGAEPRETFIDGYVVNAVIDAAYRSMRSGTWEAVRLDPGLVGA